MQHAADKGWDFDLRLAGLLHDISKPETRRWSDEKKDWTFHGHEVVGARVAKKILEDLKLPSKQVDKITKLVRWHMFFSDPDKITLSAVRRIIRNVGEEHIWDLLNLRICDRIGTGRPKEQPFRFRKYKSMVEEALRDPISVQMLKIDGARIMAITKELPGPRIGWILHALLEEALDDATKNKKEYLEARAVSLSALPLEALRKLGEAGKDRKDEAEEGAVARIREKNWVT
jgi:poly(A) polymerase/tRNA nucleotidyltransferase (CCA-adding enzyme)